MASIQRNIIGNGPGDHGETLDAVVRDMCTVEMLNGRYLIQMPVSTAYGSLVSVSVWPEGNGETFLVSDDGSAYAEVTTACANERTFTSVAKSKCARFGAEFDGCSMLFIRVAKERLHGAIVSMASLTKEVIDETLEKSFSAKTDQVRERFIKRVAEAYPDFRVTEGAHVIGLSTTPYEFDVLVEATARSLAFDFFSKSGNSVNSAYVKMSDINRLDGGPEAIGVTPNLKAIGPKLTLISSVARVIEASASMNTYKKLAA